MSVDAILRALPELENDDLRRIRDLMNSIEDQRNVEHMAEMERLIDDKDPSHWVTLEELKKRLALREDDPRE
jgi:hypothetical protein